MVCFGGMMWSSGNPSSAKHHHLQCNLQCSWGASVVSLTLSKSQCARGAASSFGMVWLRYTRYPRYTRYTRYSSTRYPRYNGHRITKISSSQWSSTTGMGKGLCWWLQQQLPEDGMGHGICPAQCWKPHHAQNLPATRAMLGAKRL